MRRFIPLIALLAQLIASSAIAQGFDHEHKAWTALLKKHVVLVEGGRASQVRYTGFQQDRAALLADTPDHRRLIEGQKAELRFLDYDGGLNDIKKP